MASWTYDADLTKKKDQVRFLIQDTQTARQLFQDQEIVWMLSQENNVYMAAAALCDIQATKMRNVSAKSVGSLSITYGSAEQWSAVAKRLRLRGSGHMQPSAGGILIAERDDFWEDSTLIKPTFFEELHQDPDALKPVRISNEETSS